MGQLGRVVEGSDLRMIVVRLRRGERQSAESKKQREQNDPFCHSGFCLSATSNRPLRGKA
jgi:hypothetical protein